MAGAGTKSRCIRFINWRNRCIGAVTGLNHTAEVWLDEFITPDVLTIQLLRHSLCSSMASALAL